MAPECFGKEAAKTMEAVEVAKKLETLEAMKKVVGTQAVADYVKSGMVVGLGTGSTALFVVYALGNKLNKGELTDIVAVPTSEKTRKLAESVGIPLSTLDDHPVVDVAIDGADEVDDSLNVLKGRGGALFREKLVAIAAKKFVVVVDETKRTKGLGLTGGVPVEICKFSSRHTIEVIEGLPELKGCVGRLRMDSDGVLPFVTDNENYIVDLFLPVIKDPYTAARALTDVVGVVEHGLFLDMASVCLVATRSGSVEVLERKPAH